jgi:HNH endonuclease
MSGVKGQKNPSIVERNKANPYWKGKKREAMAGEGNPSWVGGADKYWQRQAKIRDNYTCQMCGLRDVEIMEVDHIIPKSVMPELRHELSNLITLCPNDHRRKTNREKKAILAAIHFKRSSHD